MYHVTTTHARSRLAPVFAFPASGPPFGANQTVTCLTKLDDIRHCVIGGLEDLRAKHNALRMLVESERLDEEETERAGEEWRVASMQFWNETLSDSAIPPPVRRKLRIDDGPLKRIPDIRFRFRSREAEGSYFARWKHPDTTKLKRWLEKVKQDIARDGGILSSSCAAWARKFPGERDGNWYLKEFFRDDGLEPVWLDFDRVIIDVTKVFDDFEAEGQTDFTPADVEIRTGIFRYLGEHQPQWMSIPLPAEKTQLLENGHWPFPSELYIDELVSEVAKEVGAAESAVKALLDTLETNNEVTFLSLPQPPEEKGLGRVKCYVALQAAHEGNKLKRQNATSGATDESTNAESTRGARLTCGELAQKIGVDQERLRKRLERFRSANHTGWIEIADRKARDARYLYEVAAVEGIISRINAAPLRPAKRPPNVRRKKMDTEKPTISGKCSILARPANVH